MNEKLKIGDTISWCSNWGTEPPVDAVVKTIELCAVGSKNGRQVQSVSWDTVRNCNKNVVITMTNRHWAQSTDNSFFPKD